VQTPQPSLTTLLLALGALKPQQATSARPVSPSVPDFGVQAQMQAPQTILED